MSISAQCPRCGAPIAFHVASSMVTVCESCSTVVARTDRAVEDLGKTADLAQTQSPLQLWLQGSHLDVSFQITGRAQLRHGAGGIWDEWYLAFADGRWGWLAEAQGRFYLTFEQPSAGPVDPQNLIPGSPIQVGEPPQRMIVAEAGESEVIAGRGEIPYRLETGMRYWYADLSGAGRRFGTLDLSDSSPTLFLGHEVTLAALGLGDAAPASADPAQDELAPPPASTEGLTCDNCGGSLELRAPQACERVACPYCGALHDCNQGLLRLLSVAEEPPIKPEIPLGSQGRFEGETLTVIGFLRRRGGTVLWDEYLLYHPRVGFRWLVESNAGFTYFKPVNIAEVTAPAIHRHHDSGERASYGGTDYKLFDSGPVEVTYVAGELYWKVEVGQQTLTVDYVRPPEMLSGEATDSEVHWSLGTYMSRAQVTGSFDGLALPAATFTTNQPAPNQPYPHTRVYHAWAALLAMAVVVFLWASSIHPDRQVFSHQLSLSPDASTTEEGQVHFSEPFRLAGKKNLEVIGYAPGLSNNWVYLQADLYNQDTGTVLPFDLGIEYYSGVSGGERWSEGSYKSSRHLSSVPAGTYVLRLAVLRGKNTNPKSLSVVMRQGVFRWRYWLFALLGLSMIPVFTIFHHIGFENKRWSHSDYKPGGDDGDD